MRAIIGKPAICIKNQFDRFTRALDSFGVALETSPPKSKENLMNYVERITEKKNNHLKRMEDKGRNER